MPKNAVKRLQNIQNDIKSMFSIYDAANEQIYQMTKTIEIDPKSLYKKPINSLPLNRTKTDPPLKSRSTESNRPLKPDTDKNETCHELEKVKAQAPLKKPGSAPSTNTIFTGFEAPVCAKCKNRPYVCDCKTKKFPKQERGLSPQKKTEATVTPQLNLSNKHASNKPEQEKRREFPRKVEQVEKFLSSKPGSVPNAEKDPDSVKASSNRKPANKSNDQMKTRSLSYTWNRESSSGNSDKTEILSKSPEQPGKRPSTANAENEAKSSANKKRNVDGEMKRYNHMLERMEEMKKSKDIALDIAKQLKDKYETIQITKKDLYERITKLQEANEQLHKEIAEMNSAKTKMQTKMDELKKETKLAAAEKEKNKEIMDENTGLKDKLKEMTKKLLEKEHQISNMTKSRFTLESTEVNDLVHQKSTEYKKQLEKQEAASRDLFTRINSLEAELKASKIKEKRLIEMKAEIKKKYVKLEEEMQKIRNENKEFKFISKQVQTANVLLMEELKKQQNDLDFKSDRLEDTSKELELIRRKSQALEEQVKTLRNSIENFDVMHQDMEKRSKECQQQLKADQEKIKELEGEREKLLQDLEEAKDSVLIKNKIIDDQQETIKQLRDKGEEMKAMARKNQSLERIINLEREEKLEMQEIIENLRWRKEELKRKIKALEEDLLLAPQEVVRDLQKTQSVLHELENQVQIKQKEWEVHLQALMKEKEKACSVAEFATKKLMQTTSEFQRQSEAHKRLHRALAENLAEKERHLKEVNEKVSNTDLEHAMIKLQSETKRTTRAMDRHRCPSQDWYPRLSSHFPFKRLSPHRTRGLSAGDEEKICQYVNEEAARHFLGRDPF